MDSSSILCCILTLWFLIKLSSVSYEIKERSVFAYVYTRGVKRAVLGWHDTLDMRPIKGMSRVWAGPEKKNSSSVQALGSSS